MENEGGYIPLTEQAQAFISGHIQEGDGVIDATVGNGHDTAFLARLVGAGGKVFGFDIQPAAIETAREKLARLGLARRVEWICDCHGKLARHIPEDWHGRIQAVMINLGYLPGSDKRITTHPRTTLAALSQALDLLSPTGRISIIAYTGHGGGQEEANAIGQWLATQLPSQRRWRRVVPGGRRSPPQLFLIGQG